MSELVDFFSKIHLEKVSNLPCCIVIDGIQHYTYSNDLEKVSYFIFHLKAKFFHQQKKKGNQFYASNSFNMFTFKRCNRLY
jgi:hypothetical protein